MHKNKDTEEFKMRLENKVAVVTGASSGVGREIAVGSIRGRGQVGNGKDANERLRLSVGGKFGSLKQIGALDGALTQRQCATQFNAVFGQIRAQRHRSLLPTARAVYHNIIC